MDAVFSNSRQRALRPQRSRPFLRRVGEFLLFSPQNKRFTTLTMAVTFITLITMASVVYLATHGGSATITTLIGFAGPVVVVQMVAMLRQEQATEETLRRQEQSAKEAHEHRERLEAEIKKTRHDIKGELNTASLKMDEVIHKTNGGLSQAVVESAEQVRKAEHEQMLDDPAFRKRMAEELCPMLSDDVVRRVLEGLRDGEGAERRIDRPPYPPKVQT